MPFVNPLHRKRARSTLSPVQTRKQARFEEVLLDGTTTGGRSTDSVRGNTLGKSTVASRVQRGFSSLLGLLAREKKSDAEFGDPSDRSLVAVSGPDSSAASVIVRSRQEDDTLVQSIPDSPQDGHEIGSDPPSFISVASPASFCQGPSTPTLATKIQHRLQQTFGNHPTVVVRSGLRTRPSVQTLPNDSPEQILSQDSSSPSTYNSGSGSSPKEVLKSTPATSEGTPQTPSSVIRYEGLSVIDHDQALVFDHDLTHPSTLSSIPESVARPLVTVKTIEATASAKVFFETHFNAVLNHHCPRDTRSGALVSLMRELCVPSILHDEAHRVLQRHESENLRLRRLLKSKAIAVGGFEVVRVLGKGSFGVVRLVKEKRLHRKASLGLINLPSAATKSPSRMLTGSKQVCAMKVIRKSTMLRNGQEGHLRAERDFLVAAEGARWIVPLLAAFQDHKFLYLVMDFCIGGDFLGLLIRKNVLDEDATRWYIAEMILCVEEAHRMRWIHRDVKPDNFLIGADGHLKISDFGLAFDGHWEHDQKYFHKHREDLIDLIDLDITGDAEDIADAAEADNSRRVAEMFPPPGCPPKKHQMSEEVPEEEKILGWRNRAQKRRLARSVVGTSQYMAPEVIRGELYDGEFHRKIVRIHIPVLAVPVTTFDLYHTLVISLSFTLIEVVLMV